MVEGRTQLGSGDPLPALPRFSWAAFALPPVWGPAHGQWAGAAFLPIWLFLDNIVLAAMSRGVGLKVAAVLVLLATLGFQLFFAKRANGQAWRRVCDHESIGSFIAAQRRWAMLCVPLGVALLLWALWFRLGSPLTA